MSIKSWIAKQNAVHSYHRVSLIHEKQWSFGTCYNVDEPQRHYANWKKPDTKEQISYNSVYMRCPQKANSYKVGEWLPRTRERSEWGSDCSWVRSLFWGWWKCSRNGVDGCTHCQCIESHWIAYWVLLKVFIYFWLCQVFFAVWGLFSSCSEWRILCSCRAQASPCGGFSGCRAWTRDSQAQ